jgi:MFS family permease
MGLAVAVASFAALTWAMATGRGYLFIEPPIFFLGAGLGLVMPNMTIVVQSALPVARRGVGTAMLTFFRSLGGLLGVTGSGAILAHGGRPRPQVAELLAQLVLLDLAGGAHRQAVDEHHVVRHPPLGDLALEEGAAAPRA